MKILVISDIHSDEIGFREIMNKNKDCDVAFFLGDGAGHIQTFLSDYPNMNFYGVRGNCDIGSTLPTEIVTQISQKKIFATHGYIEQVKSSLTNLSCKAREKEAHICLFGHTHSPFMQYEYGILFLNPGAVKNGKYGIIEIDNNGKITSFLR